MVRLAAIVFCLVLMGCTALHKQQREKQWQLMWETWRIEAQDDCDYVDTFHKQDCLKRHNRQL